MFKEQVNKYTIAQKAKFINIKPKKMIPHEGKATTVEENMEKYRLRPLNTNEILNTLFS